MAFPQNAINSVTLGGIVQDTATHQFVPVALHRMTAPLDLVSPQFDPLVRPSLAPFLLESVPERLPSRLPPPGMAQLHCHAGKFIGDGHSSIVFALNDVKLDGTPPDERSVPRLVVKIARSNRLAALAREAWFYDEMECLQGSSIARCYGWFEVDLSSNQIVPAWRDHPAEESGDYDHALDHDATVHPDQLKRTARRDILSVLVLERLGDKLPPGRHSRTVRKDIVGLYEDASHLGVGIAQDVRRHNILEAPHEQPCLPSLASPFSSRTHSWRLVDFEFGLKINYTLAQFKRSYKGHVRRMFRDTEEEGAGNIMYIYPESEDSGSE
ncbi:hypothetical protein BV25DRAFT_1858711 [Artomyces pyxidatus]|uniref:Uncharacterized protein n=2 Tax=Artomyces pyxidatus TaxID=48021 RepID=A0ACB8SVC4_9AGAM|nr:hypothetical protein BV25DRAFT_1888538 [Artomyces pyxidatus]KAI0060765.1 hypothetical protein BV25DRAFT_1858711 [Artomyces pyxidatus]